jgi:2-keto-4-pentenoate hydratase
MLTPEKLAVAGRLSPGEVEQAARRKLANRDAGTPVELFAERGADWLIVTDACAIQRAVSGLRTRRGEQPIGYKIGCISPVIQAQFGLDSPVCARVWACEAMSSGSEVDPGRFANLAIEGELAVRLSDRFDPEDDDEQIARCVETWFSVIELHPFVFRAGRPTSVELIAGGAFHAGIVRPESPGRRHPRDLATAEIVVSMDGMIVERTSPRLLPGGALGALRWLASRLREFGESLLPGEIVLTGSPGRLIPVASRKLVSVGCAGDVVTLPVAAP